MTELSQPCQKSDAPGEDYKQLYATCVLILMDTMVPLRQAGSCPVGKLSDARYVFEL